jgi:hypothetical protein
MWGYEPLHPLDIPKFDKLKITHKPLAIEAFVQHQQNVYIDHIYMIHSSSAPVFARVGRVVVVLAGDVGVVEFAGVLD